MKNKLNIENILQGLRTITTGYNSTYKKLAVQCYADTFVVIENLALRNYIRTASRQVLVATKPYWDFKRLP